MITLFRRIRQKLIESGSLSKYLLYALGEIALVVIGILIALQVNNWNEDRANYELEQKYLDNIVLDLRKDISNLNDLIAFRKERLKGDRQIIDYINGEPVENLDELTYFVVNTTMEKIFTPTNITFSELSSSGNLNLISNDSLKFLLLELQELYQLNDMSVEHERFDYREYISKPFNRNADIDLLFPVYSGIKTASEQHISMDSFRNLFKIIDYKNGLSIMTFMSVSYINNYELIKNKSESIIALIEEQYP